MTATATEIARMTPAAAWETFVGDETPTAFMSNAVHGASIIDATWDYAHGSPMCDDLDAKARVAVAERLCAYLDRSGA